MDLLRLALTDGYLNAVKLGQESALDPLRDGPDFRRLLLDGFDDGRTADAVCGSVLD